MLSHLSGLSGNHGKQQQEIHPGEYPVAWYCISSALSVTTGMSAVNRFLLCNVVPATGLVA
mgnify:CR=1 FL=1